VLALALGFAACGGGDSDESADQLLDGATLQGIESADLDLSIDAKSAGKEGGDIEVRISGPFQGAGKGELPQLAMTATAQGKTAGDGTDIDFEGGLVLLPNSAYVNFEGIEYEVDPTTFSFVESALRRSERESGAAGEEGGASACREAAGEVEVARFVDEAKSEGGADVGGTETTKVSGELDVGGAIDAGIELAQSPACSAQVAAAGELPSDAEVEEAKEEVEGTVEEAKVEVYVGDDDIVRRLAAELTLAPRNGTGTTTIEFDLQLSGVNEEQQIVAPEGRTKPLSDLFIKLGINPIELLGLLQGESGGADLGDLLEGLGDSAR
jgi:hypothetical protein